MDRYFIGLVVNPNAAGHKRYPHLLRAYEGLISDHVLLRRTQSEDELSDAAREFLGSGIDVLAIAGGDGSLHATLNAFLPIYASVPLPPILIIQAGTINNISSEIGMTRFGLNVMNEIINEGQTKPLWRTQRTLIRINESYGFLYGMGFPASILKRYYDAPRQSSLRAYLLSARSILHAASNPKVARDLFNRMGCTVTIDGYSRESEDFLFVLASTIYQIGFCLRPCHLPLNGERTFHLIACSSRLRKLISRIHRLYQGRPLDVDGCLDTLAREVTIELDDPAPYMVDGELKKEEPMHHIQGDRPVSFIVDVRAP